MQLFTDFLMTLKALPHSSVGSVQEVAGFDPLAEPIFFLKINDSYCTGFIPLSMLSIVSAMVMWESSQWLGKNIVGSIG